MNTYELEEIEKFIINNQMLYLGSRLGGKTSTFTDKLKNQHLFDSVLVNVSNIDFIKWDTKLCWGEVTKVLGDVKGVVSIEDRQLLKIVHKLSDEAVDEMISEYKKQYKLYLKNSKMYGKEKWR